MHALFFYFLCEKLIGIPRTITFVILVRKCKKKSKNVFNVQCVGNTPDNFPTNSKQTNIIILMVSTFMYCTIPTTKKMLTNKKYEEILA